MSKFIKTQNGSFVGTSEIVSVHNLDTWACTIKTKNGESYQVDDRSCNVANLIDHDNCPIIPASAGYSVIRALPPNKEGGKWYYELLPVIGWQKLPSDDCVKDSRAIYDVLGRSTPIVAGYVHDTITWSLVLPDGRVIDSMYHVHNNIHEWFDAHVADRTGQKEEKNKKKTRK